MVYIKQIGSISFLFYLTYPTEKRFYRNNLTYLQIWTFFFQVFLRKKIVSVRKLLVYNLIQILLKDYTEYKYPPFSELSIRIHMKLKDIIRETLSYREGVCLDNRVKYMFFFNGIYRLKVETFLPTVGEGSVLGT